MPGGILINGQHAEVEYTPKQKTFVNSDARYPLMYGGLNSGKTAALCRRALRFSIAYPGNRGLLARYHLGGSSDALLMTWRKFIPAQLYTLRADDWGWVLSVRTSDPDQPSQILVRALDDPGKIAGLELGWFGISQANETGITRRLWDMLDSRLNRWVLPDGTKPPATGFAEANSGAPWIIDLWGPEREHTMPGYEAIEVSIYDNRHVEPEYLAAMEAKPAWWKRWWLYPCWEPLTDLEGDPVFKGHYRSELHVSTEPLTPERGWPIIRGWDLPGPVATVWFQITRKGRLLILYDQLGEASAGIPDMKRLALSASQTLFPNWTFLDLADPAAFTKASTDRRSPADLLRPEIIVTRGETSLQSRLSAGQNWLDRMVDGKPALQIDPRCRLLITALEGGYVWKTAAGQVLPEPQKNQSSHVVDAWLHALARVGGQMDPAERMKWRGPKVLIPQ